MRNDFAFVILCWKRPDKLHTLKLLKKLNYQGAVYFAIDNDDPTKEDYISVAEKNGIKYFTFDKDVNVSDQMFNNNLKSGAVCTRKVVENVIRDKGYRFFCVLDDDYVNIYDKDNKQITLSTLNNLINASCDILQRIPFVSVISLAQGGECVGGKQDFYNKSKFKLKAMNWWFCDTQKPIEYKGFMNDDVNAGILLNKFGNFSVQYGGLFIIQAMQKTGGMKNVCAMYQKATFSIMLEPSFVRLGYLMNYTGKRPTKRIYHKILREFAYPYIVE